MTGFIRGLFSRNNNQPRAPKPPKPNNAFFLSEDDAKTFGDIDYMRSSKVVKRTFARKKGQTEEIESVRQISAMEKRDVNENNFASPLTQAQMDTSSEAPKPTETPQFQRRSTKTDTSMDMFRNMAKDIKKR